MRQFGWIASFYVTVFLHTPPCTNRNDAVHPNCRRKGAAVSAVPFYMEARHQSPPCIRGEKLRARSAGRSETEARVEQGAEGVNATRGKRAIYRCNEAKWMGDALRPCETILWIAKRDGRVVVPHNGAPRSSPPTVRERPNSLLLRGEGGRRRRTDEVPFKGFTVL